MKREILLHGGALDQMKARFPDAPAPWLDLSTGINPWPFEYSVDIRRANAHLPTAAQFAQCAAALAAAVGASVDSLLLAPGSELLIRLLPTVLSVRRVSVTAQSYGDHAASWRDAGVDVVESLNPLDDIDDCDAAVICSPNNPDGRCWSPAALCKAQQQLADKGGWLIVDEAYMDLYPQRSILTSPAFDGLVVFRSFGKFFGLAGVRLGALFAPLSILEAMSVRLGVWPVSGPALAIGTEAYRDLDWQAATRQRVAAARTKLDRTLQNRDLTVVGGTDLFRLVRVECALAWWQRLAELGIYTRYFDWSERYLRIGLPSTDAELERLDAALGEISLST